MIFNYLHFNNLLGLLQIKTPKKAGVLLTCRLASINNTYKMPRQSLKLG